MSYSRDAPLGFRDTDCAVLEVLEMGACFELLRESLVGRDQSLPELGDRPMLKSWLPAEWDTWLAVDIVAITGRRVHEADAIWAFDVRGYR